MNNISLRERAYGLLTEGKYDELIEYITPHIEAKSSWAEAILGQCYQIGAGVEQDPVIARHYFELSANQKDPQGQLLFGHHLLLEGQTEEGRAQLESAYHAGMKSAADYIAQSFFTESDKPGTESFSIGLSWLERSAEGGNKDAMHQLGWLIGKSGDDESLSQALIWYERAAARGSIDSAYNAGLAYEKGFGTQIDYVKARHFYTVAADAGLTSAIHNLGVLYYDGKGGDIDKEAAFNCYNAAAAKGSFLSSQSLSKMFAAGEIMNLAPNKALELAWLMIAEQQAKELGHIESAIVSKKKQLLQDLPEDVKADAISCLEVIGETSPNWVSAILAEQFLSGEIVSADIEKAELWKAKIADDAAVPSEQIKSLETPTDLASLPERTQQFIDWLPQLGFSVQQIHGLFVLVGLYAGTPRTAEEIEELFTPLELVIPHDRSLIIDHLLEEFFEEYQLPLEEFCLRSRYEFDLRPIQVSESIDAIHVLDIRDHGLLDPEVREINNLASASRLFQSLLTALGESTFRQKRSMKEAFLSGIYQMQLMGKIDLSAVQQLSSLINTTAPPLIAHAFRAFTANTIDYSLGCEREQVPLQMLMSPMGREYAEQLWGFQSALFFHEGQRIRDVSELNEEGWHRWVTDRARAFDDAYSDRIVGFTKSGITLTDIPIWGEGINDFLECDEFINCVWGLSSTNVKNYMEQLEYKALVIHVVYASLTMSKEMSH